MYATHADDLDRFDQGEPYSYYAEADREAHYLFTAGFVTSCDCFRCDAIREADAQQAYEEEEAERYAAERDAADPFTIEAEAARLFDQVVAWQERFAPRTPAVDDEYIPF